MPLCFFLMFQPPLVGEENYFQLVFKPVILLTFTVLWLEKLGIFLKYFLLFNSVTSAVTAYNVGVFKPTIHDLSKSSYLNTKFV